LGNPAEILDMNYIAKGTSFSSVIILKNENGSDSSRSSKGAVKLENAHKHTTLDYEDLLDDLSSHSSQKDTDRRLITQLILENQDSKNGKIVYEERFSVLEKKVKNMDVEKTSLETKVKNMDLEIKNMDVEKTSLEKKVKNMDLEKTSLETKVENMDLEKTSLETKVKNMESNMEKIQKNSFLQWGFLVVVLIVFLSFTFGKLKN